MTAGTIFDSADDDDPILGTDHEAAIREIGRCRLQWCTVMVGDVAEARRPVTVASFGCERHETRPAVVDGAPGAM